eukprot:193168_1
MRYKDKNVQIYLQSIPKSEKSDFSKQYPATPQPGVVILSSMLQFDVTKRITATDALKSKYFDDVRDAAVEQRQVKAETFEFEDIEIDQMTLRALILDEIIYFNPKWKKELMRQHKQKQKELKQLHSPK